MARITINKIQEKQIQELKETNHFTYNWQVIDLLLKNQKYHESLENIIKKVHMTTKL